MIKDQIQSINSNSDLSYQEMESAINSIMSGNESDGDIEEFLLALNTKVFLKLKYQPQPQLCDQNLCNLI